MTRPHDRLREAISNLSRDDLRKLSARVGIGREALIDFADINIAIEPAAMEKLEEWFHVFSLRALLADPHLAKLCDPLQQDSTDAIFQACGISRHDLGDFIAEKIELDVWKRDNLFRFIAHGGKPSVPGAVSRIGDGGPALSELLALRGKAKSIINSMGPDALRAFIAAHKAAA